MPNFTARSIAALKPRTKSYSKGDGKGSCGLRLRILPNGVKGWYQTLRFEGKIVNVGLGGFPAVSLADARRRAQANAVKAREGVDPRRHAVDKRPSRARLRRPERGTATLRQCVEQVIALRRPSWKNTVKQEREWRGSFKHAEHLMDRLLEDIKPMDAQDLLVPLMAEVPSTAKYLRARLSMAYEYAAMSELHDGRNPFKSLMLPSGNGHTHRKALDYRQAPGAVRQLRGAKMHRPNALALELQLLTAVRPIEALQVRWSEIDLDRRLWVLPPERTKANTEHRVPLSAAAIDVLERAKPHSNGDLVFPASRGGLMDSNNNAARALKKAGIDVDAHGFRAAFKTWCSETGVDRELAETALAHKVGNAVEQAYQRSTLTERRRPLMDAWGKYCAGGSIHRQSR